MRTSDSSAIVNALMARLGADETLLALMPNGVYYDVSANGATRYVLVSRIIGQDVAAFGGRAIEENHFQVKAVGLSSALATPDDMRAAAARIDELLEDEPFEADGYGWMSTHRTEPIDERQVDGTNHSLRWYHRGGIYLVEFAVATNPQRIQRERVQG